MRTFSKSAWMKVLHPNTNCQYPNTSRTWSVKKITLSTLLSNFLVSHSYKQAPVSKNTPFSYDWNMFKVFVIITKFQAKHCRKNLVKVKIWRMTVANYRLAISSGLPCCRCIFGNLSYFTIFKHKSYMATTILLHNNCSLKWSVETQQQKI